MAESSIAALFRNDGAGVYTVSGYWAPSTDPVAAVHIPIPFIENPSQTGSPITISGATNAAPIVLTVPSGHGVVANDNVYVQNVGGNTNANGTFIATSVTATTITLAGSSGNAAYTSGGTLHRLAGTKSLYNVVEAFRSAIQAWKAAGN